jgi:hypothetical protein
VSRSRRQRFHASQFELFDPVTLEPAAVGGSSRNGLDGLSPNEHPSPNFGQPCNPEEGRQSIGSGCSTFASFKASGSPGLAQKNPDAVRLSMSPSPSPGLAQKNPDAVRLSMIPSRVSAKPMRSKPRWLREVIRREKISQAPIGLGVGVSVPPASTRFTLPGGVIR